MRDAQGVPHIDGPRREDVLWGLGFCHALDRGLSLLLTRIVGQGRASECLGASDEALEVDVVIAEARDVRGIAWQWSPHWES
jgi:penicillin amidase